MLKCIGAPIMDDKAASRKITLINTLGDRCRVCYTCVRDCPAKAIRITGGQAQVIPERCIGCGNCVRVCSQKAKLFYDSLPEVREILAGSGLKTAIVAPSFPAEFTDFDPRLLVQMIRRLGFDHVCEVGFGADLVAAEYRRLLQDFPDRRFIATTCPAIVAYIEKYHPGMVGDLAPIVSPMVATARVLRRLHGHDQRVVFIGPCIAKKAEAVRNSADGREIDAALTFTELRELFRQKGILPHTGRPSEFDPPHPGLGALFSLSGGMLQAADMREDLLDSRIITADGKNHFVDAILEFKEGVSEARLLEVLCCHGCVRGAGMSNDIPFFSRRHAVSSYVRERQLHGPGKTVLPDEIRADLDLAARFVSDDTRLPMPSLEELEAILRRMGKLLPGDELNCGACGYHTCREHAVAIHKGLAENEMCLPFTIDRLKQSLTDLHASNHQLAQTREALNNAEKLAGMGQLSAGIAHEINNPLGVILLNANLMLSSVPAGSEDHEDLKLIVEQAERCRKIVAGLLNFARRNRVLLQPTDLRRLVQDCLKTISHGDQIRIVVDDQMQDPVADMDHDQIVQVLTNLLLNAIEAMSGGGDIHIALTDTPQEASMAVADTGTGIPRDIINKIFEPLFTTKQIGKGTGLGLAVTYGIVKMHRGQIDVASNADPARGPTGTTFTVTLPRRAAEDRPVA
jgi:signal transduction histidine kinase/Pyruvate/2-oxoacid:ferredoxin oxidoreductase delta subunit